MNIDGNLGRVTWAIFTCINLYFRFVRREAPHDIGFDWWSSLSVEDVLKLLITTTKTMTVMTIDDTAWIYYKLTLWALWLKCAESLKVHFCLFSIIHAIH